MLSRRLLPVVLLSALFLSFTAGADELLRFDLNNYEGWTYTRSSVELNTTNISREKITLFRTSLGDYTLVSPAFQAATAQKITVHVKGYSHNYSQSSYDAAKGSPTLELLDDDGNVVTAVKQLFTTAEFVRDFEVSLSVPAPGGSLRLRLAAWDADVNSALAVSEVTATAGAGCDVNGDGQVSVADVTAAYDVVLGLAGQSALNPDVNGDGQVSVADVTAIYDFILGTE